MASSSAIVGSLAIRRPARPSQTDINIRPTDVGATVNRADITASDPADSYLTSLAKLFPAEALSALLLVLSIDPQFGKLRLTLIVVIAIALVALRYLATWDAKAKKADYWAVFVSLISFIIYAAAMMAFGVLFGTNEETTRLVATVAGILWMALLTAWVRKKSVS